MAIAAQNAAYLNLGPSFTGQVLAPNENTGLENCYIGTATFTLDGTLTAATLNFIDGTQTLPFVPAGVTAEVVGGTQTATAVIGVVSTNVPTNTGVVINFTIAGTATRTVKVLFQVFK